ncbi:hypothetical protein Nepgr_033672 [Nepenthes gracilis]|uniref:Uncharacterized protein n=1 Tax=Nepenthes gracilis TaxID=150966 RepID=A0AAD3Y741_NEPGR|nr:hypothetical protein Nepgr_033672 [Nepenthes gracilis]
MQVNPSGKFKQVVASNNLAPDGALSGDVAPLSQNVQDVDVISGTPRPKVDIDSSLFDASGHENSADGASREAVMDNQMGCLPPAGLVGVCIEVPVPKELDELKINSGSGMQSPGLLPADVDPFGLSEADSSEETSSAAHSGDDVSSDYPVMVAAGPFVGVSAVGSLPGPLAAPSDHQEVKAAIDARMVCSDGVDFTVGADMVPAGLFGMASLHLAVVFGKVVILLSLETAVALQKEVAAGFAGASVSSQLDIEALVFPDADPVCWNLPLLLLWLLSVDSVFWRSMAVVMVC